MTEQLISVTLKYDPIYSSDLRVTIGYYTGLANQNYTISYPQSETILEAVARVVLQACLLKLRHPGEHDEPVFTSDEVLRAEAMKGTGSTTADLGRGQSRQSSTTEGGRNG
jgi:hypothetical protein